MTFTIASAALPAAPIKVRAAARPDSDGGSPAAPVYAPAPEAIGPAPRHEAAAEAQTRAATPADTQPLAPSVLAVMIELQERAAVEGERLAPLEALRIARTIDRYAAPRRA
jgi:hypothetical protein